MTQAKEELEKLLADAEAYRHRNELDSVTLTVTGHGTGHAYAYRGASQESVSIGAWRKMKPQERQLPGNQDDKK